MKNPFVGKHAVSIELSSIVFAVCFVLFLYFLYLIRSILVLVLCAFIIMVALNPLARFFNRKLRFPKHLSIALTYVIFALGMTGLLAVIVPPLAEQMRHLASLIHIPLVQDFFRGFEFSVQELDTLISRIGSSAGVVLNIISTTFNGVFTTFTLIVLSFYLMLERDTLHRKFSWFTRERAHLEQASRFLDSLEKQLGGWVRAQVILMVAIGLITYIGLTLLSIPYALPLALLAGLLEVLPNLGPTIAAVPVIFVAYAAFGPVMALITLLFAIVVQQIENNLLVPKVMSDNAHVGPLVSIVAILVGLSLGGVVGALLAIPLYITARSVYSILILPKLEEKN